MCKIICSVVTICDAINTVLCTYGDRKISLFQASFYFRSKEVWMDVFEHLISNSVHYDFTPGLDPWKTDVQYRQQCFARTECMFSYIYIYISVLRPHTHIYMYTLTHRHTHFFPICGVFARVTLLQARWCSLAHNFTLEHEGVLLGVLY